MAMEEMEMVVVEIMVVGAAVVEEVVAAVVVGGRVPLGHRQISIPHRSSSRT